MSLRQLVSAEELADWVRDARERTFELVADLSDEQLMGPELSTVNPGLWEMGHHAWFQSVWALRHACGEPPVRADEDALYDSMEIAHDTRWGLPLPSRDETLEYMREVRDRLLRHLAADPSEELLYHALYSTLHEDMHTEAFTYTRQTHGYPPPKISGLDGTAIPGGGPLPGDVEVPGGAFLLGSTPDEPFVFDNEKWAFSVKLEPFRIARACVTQGSTRHSSTTAGTNSGSTGAAKAGSGGCRTTRADTATSAGGAADGSAGASIPGCRSSRTRPSSTSTGSRRTRTAAGRAGACRPKPNGRRRQRPRRRREASIPGRRNAGSPGATARRHRTAPTSTGAAWGPSTSEPFPPGTAPTAAAR